MAAARSFDDKRARIQAIASGEASPAEARAELKKYLADKVTYLVTQAAEAAEKLELSELIPDLSAAFMRLLVDGSKVDRGCLGKNRILEAMINLDARAPEVYLAGLHYVQLEYSFGPPTDAAAGLRGACAHALIHIDYPGAIFEIVPLLFDKEAMTRTEAAAALGESGLDAAVAALHVLVLTEEKTPDVLGAAYKGLLRVYPNRYRKLVTGALLNGGEGEAEAAALALGESRIEGALDALKQGFEAHAGRRSAEAVALGVALLRSDAANEYLVSVVEKGPEGQAAAAISALALHRHDEALAGRVSKIIDARKSRKLREVFTDRFKPESG